MSLPVSAMRLRLMDPVLGHADSSQGLGSRGKSFRAMVGQVRMRSGFRLKIGMAPQHRMLPQIRATFRDPHNKTIVVLGLYLGPPYFWKLP